jgi:hypothetical protein
VDGAAQSLITQKRSIYYYPWPITLGKKKLPPFLMFGIQEIDNVIARYVHRPLQEVGLAMNTHDWQQSDASRSSTDG